MTRLFTVKDQVSNTYIKPFALPTKRDAIDGFRRVVNEEESPYNKHPQDYFLYELGSFDERTGKIEILPESIMIAPAVDLLTKKQ